MSTYIQGQFIPKNPQKYGGKYPITFRSGWEQTFCRYCDDNPGVLGWMCESISIPYRNPVKNKWTVYIPDFVVVYVDKNGQKHCEMIEIKPEKEVPGFSGRVNTHTKLAQAVNAAKWQAAIIYCAKRGWKFRVCTEKSMFGFTRKAK